LTGRKEAKNHPTIVVCISEGEGEREREREREREKEKREKVIEEFQMGRRISH